MKYQITLPEELAYRLKEAAARRDIPLAQFIRETMEERLAQGADTSISTDAFARIRGIVDVGEKTLSTQIDDTLYGSWDSA